MNAGVLALNPPKKSNTAEISFFLFAKFAVYLLFFPSDPVPEGSESGVPIGSWRPHSEITGLEGQGVF